MAGGFNIGKFKHTMRIQVNRLWERDQREDFEEERAGLTETAEQEEHQKLGKDTVNGRASGPVRAVFSSATPSGERQRVLLEEREEVLFEREPPAKPARLTQNGHYYKDFEEGQWGPVYSPTTYTDDPAGELPTEYDRDTNLLFKPPGPKGVLSLPARYLCASCPKLQIWQNYIWIGIGVIAAIVLFILMAFFIVKALENA